jgi:hypothetical protein
MIRLWTYTVLFACLSLIPCAAVASSPRPTVLASCPIIASALRPQVGEFRLLHVCVRSGGRRIVAGWGTGDSLEEAVKSSIRNGLRSEPGAERKEVDAAQVFFVDSSEPVLDISEIRRGVDGFHVSWSDGGEARISPLESIARNESPARALRRLIEEQSHGLQTRATGVQPTIHRLVGRQFHLALREPYAPVALFRGNQIVSVAEVTRERVTELRDGLERWLIANMDDSGRLPYKYWPSSGKYSDANNPIRQWLATLALAESASNEGIVTPEMARLNAAANLKEFFRCEGEFGLIEFQGEVKLGALAVAAMALHHSALEGRYRPQEESIRLAIDSLHQPDGRFTTFFKPRSRSGMENFYPGETLLYWACGLGERSGTQEHERFQRSAEYYMEWHLREENRNPAFVPYHTLAYASAWRLTGSDWFREAIFEINDWLAGLQRIDHAEPDVLGDFYSSDHAEYGPSHTSSTAVYLESLVKALAVARESEDLDWAGRYREAIILALRNLIQLQFADDVDAFYVARQVRVFGALRTSPWDNSLRIDNVAHALLAVSRALEVLGDEDFAETLTEPPSRN